MSSPVYRVYSEIPMTDGIRQLETYRTDRKIAEQDVDIIKTILGRKAWIEEQQR